MKADDYIQGDIDHNVQVALKRLKDIYWKSNPTTEEVQKYMEAEEIIISVLVFDGFDVVRKEERRMRND